MFQNLQKLEDFNCWIKAQLWNKNIKAIKNKLNYNSHSTNIFFHHHKLLQNSSINQNQTYNFIFHLKNIFHRSL